MRRTTTKGLVFLSVCLVAAGALACEIEIDIKPGSYPNSVNLGRQGLMSVAALAPTADAFDYAFLDQTRLAVDRASWWYGVKPERWAWEDVNKDGIDDVVFKFSIPKLVEAGVLHEGTTELVLVIPGNWNEYWPNAYCQWNSLEGSDSIRIVPSKNVKADKKK